MPIPRPYRRIARPFVGNGGYVTGPIDESHLVDARYASDRVGYIHAYRLIEEDFIRTFDYLEPADSNASAYSHRLYQLLLRACTEFEANAKAVLRANGFTTGGNLNVTDYFRLEAACRLSEYEMRLPVWNGASQTFRPFSAWGGANAYTPLSWYRSYNAVKHNRSDHFTEANLLNVMNAVGGVFALLFAQFSFVAFDPYRPVGMYFDDSQGFSSHPGSVFHVRFPAAWPDAEKYDFDWSLLRSQPDPFQNYAF